MIDFHPPIALVSTLTRDSIVIVNLIGEIILNVYIDMPEGHKIANPNTPSSGITMDMYNAGERWPLSLVQDFLAVFLKSPELKGVAVWSNNSDKLVSVWCEGARGASHGLSRRLHTGPQIVE